VPKTITQFRIFIASPSGLEEERRRFRQRLVKFTEQHAHHKDTLFHPVGWEDTVGGVGRPQELINQDLKECDYAVFVLHDHWGSPTGDGFSSGVEEEWRLAEELYQANKIRNIALFFKQVDPGRLRDPGEQLTAVLAFKRTIETGKRYLFKQYDTPDRFDEMLDSQLAEWLHRQTPTGMGLDDGITVTTTQAPPPGFDYWIGEGRRLYHAGPSSLPVASYFVTKAIEAAATDLEWARATNLFGAVANQQGKSDVAEAAFAAVVERLPTALDVESREEYVKALFHKGPALWQLGRAEEAIAVYDNVLAQFGAASEPSIHQWADWALYNKARALEMLGRTEEALAAYDDALARFKTAKVPPIREMVAMALVYKASTLSQLGRVEDAIVVCDDVLVRFGKASGPIFSQLVADALVNKATALSQLGREDDAIAVCDDVIVRFGKASEPPILEQVVKAQQLKDRLRR
jgi:tetratricopeptide (TPR) repeat protein